MAEVGLLAPDARVELIEGEIVDMAPIGTTHAGIVNFLNRLLVRAAGDRAVVTIQQPIRLSMRSEPQPDVALLKMRTDLYRKNHPMAPDVLLLIEVSDTTLRFDRGPKLALYAKHGVAEVWIIDVEGKQVHCMREPQGDQYLVAKTLSGADIAVVSALSDISIEVAQLFD